MSRACSDCSSPISKGSLNGRCRPCANALRNRGPEMREVARRNMRAGRASGRIVTSPEARSAAMKRHIAENPETLVRLAEMGRKGAASITPEMLKLRGIKQSQSLQRKRAERLAWCPADRVEEYEQLGRRIGVAEARRIIEADLAAIERRRLAAMTPFERQMDRVRNGAGISERIDLRRPDHAFTLGGVASGAL